MSNLMSPAICEAVTAGSPRAPDQSSPPPARHELGSLRDALETARRPAGKHPARTKGGGAMAASFLRR